MKGYFIQRGKTWTYRIDLPIDQKTGKRKQKSKGGFPTKKKAQEDCAIELAKIANGDYITDEQDITLDEYLKVWLTTYAKPNYKPTSLDTATFMIEARIIPALGQLKLSKITPIIIEQFYEKLHAAEYSSEYISNIHSLIRRTLRQAYKWDMMKYNVMEKVNTPKKRRKTMEFWNLEEWNHFLKVAHGHVHFIFYSLALRAGMRKAEVSGLRWSDIDFEKKTLTILQTVVKTRNALIFQDTAKTDNSQRVIEMDKYLIEELKERRKQVIAKKLEYGPSYKDHDLVFCYEDGGAVKPKRLTESMDVLTRKAGLKKIRVHDLRHTHASFLLWLGINPKVAAERMGMSIQMFNERYSHLLPTMQREAVDHIELALENYKKAEQK
ncbi:integrase [Paenibacillus sp. V4I3]|uniref:site-specific integrase n=1 Tax=Paenibacillus sp. V4I3 TaxID=3042305 RepID=UPI00277E456C|nr:site-specific integrase [Paenibacillus sp. V4I3]MDQ0876799.1 integrase [Paenibacillus sp. V4I3]